MKEFVNRIDDFMLAFLEREALPAGKCSECDVNLSRWRCRDCMFPTIMCRKCIRKNHHHEPFHRIECWTGSYFRAAAMWEVGGYVLVRHHGETQLCKPLQTQKELLDHIQGQQDILEQELCCAVAAPGGTEAARPEEQETDWGREYDQSKLLNEKTTDDLILGEMDRLHSQRRENGPTIPDDTILGDYIMTRMTTRTVMMKLSMVSKNT